MSNNKGERGMWKNRNKIWLTIIVVFVCMFGSVGMAFAAETGTPVTTESMEIRTGEKVGLRTISAVDKAYVEKLRSEGKNVTYGTVALPATVLEKVNGTLEIGKSYTYNKKVYKVLNIPGEEIWKTTEDKIYFTGVLTGISGSGFNTRYAVRSYISVDGKVTYGNTLTQSPYTIAQDMISSEDVATSQKSWLATNVIDACDDAKKVTKETLTITSADLKNGKYTLEATSKIRNYKKVIVDSSVNNGEIILDNIRVRNLEVAADASCTITANNVSFDKISKVAGKSRTAGNLVLNLGAGSNVTELSASSNMTITGDLKIAKVTVDNKVENFVVNTPAEKLTVSENASGSKIEVNKMVEDAVLAGENSTISGTGKIDKVEDNGNNDVQVEVLSNSIVSVEVSGTNRMIVTLERATEKPLQKEDMMILCPGGTDMTIIKVETKDNRVYNVTTSVFAKDDTYTFSIELESGKIIQKEFNYKVDCPTVSNATVLRSEATRAEFDLFDVDEGGYVYVYIPGHTQVSKATDIPSVETVKKGYKQQIKTGFNKVMIRGLESGISYQLYYVLEAHDGRSSEVLGPIAISGSVQEDPNISKEYSIVSVGEKPKNTITIVLNKAPEEELTLDNFSFICPTDSEITIDKAQLKVSEDKTTYTIVIPDDYGHKDNQYTAKVTFQDGTVAKKTFTVEYTPPRITNQKVERISETEVRYSFTSDEDGVLYYGTYTWNDESNASWNNTPTGKQILSGAVASTKVQMHAGQNTVEFTYNGTDEDIFAFYVDEKGNYAGYTEHKEIPAYVPPVKPDESKPAIESIVYNKDLSDSWTTCLDVTFTTGIDWLPNQKLIQIQVIEGSSPGKVLWSTEFLDGEQKKLRMTTMNGAFKTGTYKMSMYIEKDGQLLKVEKEFTID